MPPLTRLDESHVPQISVLYGRAFYHDPLYRNILPDDSTRETLAGWELGLVARYCLRFGEVYATPGLTGCACWLPPGQTDFTEERMAQVGMDAPAARLGPQAAARYDIFVKESEHYHHQVAPGAHWYLVVLGVEPAEQGRGLGRALLQPILARADAGGHPIYLETAHKSNLDFYAKFGFTVKAQAPLSGGGAYLWYLVRAPIVYPSFTKP